MSTTLWRHTFTRFGLLQHHLFGALGVTQPLCTITTPPARIQYLVSRHDTWIRGRLYDGRDAEHTSHPNWHLHFVLRVAYSDPIPTLSGLWCSRVLLRLAHGVCDVIGLRVVDRVQELGLAAVEREVWTLKVDLSMSTGKDRSVAAGVDA